MTVPDPEMVHYELDTLRVMNGETVPGWVGGAAANVCCSWLKARGYAEGFYSISQKGREYLAALAALSSEVPPNSPSNASACTPATDTEIIFSPPTEEEGEP